MTARAVKTQDPVADYKALLRELIDRRPSGARQRIADALGKNKSFVSQITNPAYATPVPARHLSAIFELCHFSLNERADFMEAYDRAHPGRRPEQAGSEDQNARTLTIEIPCLNDSRRRKDLVSAIQLYAKHAIALAQSWDDVDPIRRKGKKRT